MLFYLPFSNYDYIYQNLIMDTQAARLQSIIKLYDSSMAAFEKKCGLSNASISLPIRQKRNFSYNTIKKICQHFPISEYWLYCGKGEVFKEELTLCEHIVKLIYELGIDFIAFESLIGLAPGSFQDTVDNQENQDKYELLNWVNSLKEHNPNLDLSWALEFDDDYVDFSEAFGDYEEVDRMETEQLIESMVKGNDLPREDSQKKNYISKIEEVCDFEFEITEDSLAPNSTCGDVAICKTVDISKAIIWNNVYYIETNNISVVRIIKPDDNPDNIKCVARNEEYDPITIPRNEIVRAGIVISVIKKRA